MNLPRQKLQKNHCHFKINVYYVHVSFGGFFFSHAQIFMYMYICTPYMYIVYRSFIMIQEEDSTWGKSEKNSRFLPFKVHLIIFEL